MGKNTASPKTEKLNAALAEYDNWVRTNPDVDHIVKQKISETLDDAGITYDQVSVRIKDRTSYIAKLRNPNYPNYEDFASAYDIVGIRVTTFHSSEIEQLLDVVSDIFTIERVVDKAAETANRGGFGYASQHVIGFSETLGRSVEVQLRTVLQHAWAEFEHDVRYKNPRNAVDPEVHRAFTLAAGLIELADEQFDKIAQITDNELSEAENEEIETRSLPALLNRLLGSTYPTSRADYYGWAVDMLAAHGITTTAELAKLLSDRRLKSLTNAMNYPYKPGQVRLIDDMLLFTFGRDHIRKTVRIGENIQTRPGRLGNRWQQLGQQTYAEYQESQDQDRSLD